MACRARDPFADAAQWTPPALPTTPAGVQAAGYFAALDSGEAAVEPFVLAHFSERGPDGNIATDRTGPQLRLARESGGVEVYEITKDEPYALGAIVRFRLTRAWRELTVFVDDTPPHRIAGIMLIPVDPPASLRERAGDGGERPDLAAYLTQLAGADAFSGAVALDSAGAVGFAEAYGRASESPARPNDVRTRFGYASVGKMFTGVAVAQLVEAGRLRYDATVGELLPAFASTRGAGLTVDQLLTHRNGLVDIFEDFDRLGAVARAARRQSDFFPLFIDEPLRQTPGEGFAYSNSGYIVLGAIVEAVSGQAYGDYLAAHVFGPAGMTHTRLDAAGAPADSLAAGYTALDERMELVAGPRRAVTRFDGTTGTAAGGGITTVGDLLRFAAALADHRLLSPAALATVLTARTPSDHPGAQYGYGFYLRDTPAGRAVGHSGGAHGVDAQLWWWPECRRTLAVLANYEGVGQPVVEYVEGSGVLACGTGHDSR